MLTPLTVSYLEKQWKKVCHNLANHTEALALLMRSIGDDPKTLALLKQYEDDMRMAEAGRRYPTDDTKKRHPMSLDIYDMKENQGKH